MIRDPRRSDLRQNAGRSQERWRKRVKFDLLKETADDVPMDEAVEKLRKRYNSIRKSWSQTDNDELLERYLSAMTTGFDPHSDYMSPSTLDNFNIMMRLELDGIGASLRSEDGYTVVHNIIPGGAADKDGRLKPDDKIVGVGQGTGRADGRHRRHEAQRRGREDPRQAQDHRPPGGRSRPTARDARPTRSPATASSSKTAKPAARSSSAARSRTASRIASA